MVDSPEPVPAASRLINREALIRLEPDAVDSFVKLTIDRIHSLLYQILGHRQEAEDMTQEVYMRAFRALPTFRGEAEPMTWIYRIAINCGRDAIARRQAARKRDGGEIDPDAHAAPDDPAANAVESEELRVLRGALGRLDEEWRNVILLVDIEGLSMEEAGQTLQVPTGTVKSRLHRAREALREEVKRMMGGKS